MLPNDLATPERVSALAALLGSAFLKATAVLMLGTLCALFAARGVGRHAPHDLDVDAWRRAGGSSGGRARSEMARPDLSDHVVAAARHLQASRAAWPGRRRMWSWR